MDESDEEEDLQEKVPDVLDFTEPSEVALAGERPEWFTETDARIILILATDLTLTPSIIAENINSSRVTVSRRLNSLQAGGLVEKVDRGKYKITKRGQELASGDPERNSE